MDRPGFYSQDKQQQQKEKKRNKLNTKRKQREKFHARRHVSYSLEKDARI
jgi:hypothetical protein